MIRKYEWINGCTAVLGWFLLFLADARANDTFGGVCNAIVMVCMVMFTIRLYKAEKNQVA